MWLKKSLVRNKPEQDSEKAKTYELLGVAHIGDVGSVKNYCRSLAASLELDI